MGNTYDELLKQYRALLQENERLQTENDRLRVLLEQSTHSAVSEAPTELEEQAHSSTDTDQTNQI